MNAAESLLAEKRQRLAAMERELELARAELSGMEMFAKAFATANLIQPASVSPRVIPHRDIKPPNGGRQPGSISKRWRTVLWHLHDMGGSFSAADIVATVRDMERRELRLADAKRQMDNYATLGFVVGSDGVYNVTDEFMSKFADAADGFTENGPVSADSDDQDEGAATPSHLPSSPQLTQEGGGSA